MLAKTKNPNRKEKEKQMIASLPDREIQLQEAERKRLEPKNRFQFLWDAFFRSRKFKLSQEDLAELEGIEKNLQRWNDAAGRIWSVRNNPQEVFDSYAGKYLNEPTEANYIAMMAHTFSQPFHGILMSRAGEQIEGYLAGERQRLYAPLVRKHLTRIYHSLLAEYSEQEKADKRSLQRLEGIASGGESQACIELRNQAERIRGLLDGGDLSNWREALGAFLP
jgi:hypothetical protein